MTRLSTLLVPFALLAIGTACGGDCEAILAAEQACLDELEAAGGIGSGTADACENNPGKSITECMIDVYESADCTSEQAVSEAEEAANECVVSAGPF